MTDNYLMPNGERMTVEDALNILDTIPTISEQVDALEMAIEALEKQIPKKPIFVYTVNMKALDEPIQTDVWHCPTCGLTYNTKEHHCICGQKIDWSCDNLLNKIKIATDRIGNCGQK